MSDLDHLVSHGDSVPCGVFPSTHVAVQTPLFICGAAPNGNRRLTDILSGSADSTQNLCVSASYACHLAVSPSSEFNHCKKQKLGLAVIEGFQQIRIFN